MMRLRRLPGGQWYAALALFAAIELANPRTGQAGLLTISENLPNTGYSQAFVLGAGANTPLSSGQSYNVSIPAFTTPDGRFEFFINSIAASDPNGFPSITGSMTVENVLGGQGSLFLDDKQFFVPNAIFNNGCFGGAALVGSFTETSPHGNNVVGVGIVAGQALPPLSASDFAGGSFNVGTGYFFLPSPTSYEGQVTFNFTAGSQAGDAITLPFTILPPTLSPASAPEPPSWIMGSTGALSGLGYWWNRRRRGRMST
jgi:hypothetical protein